MAYGGDPHDNPYSAPQEDIAPLGDVGPTKAYGYAGFWIRFVARLIDELVLTLIFLVAGVAIGVVFGLVMAMTGNVPKPRAPGQPADLDPMMSLLIVIVYGVFGVAYFGYYALMESSSYQATLGKMVFGLKVTDLSGRRISLGRAFGRVFGKILSSIPCAIGFIMAGFTEKKQALHDLIASTLVVKTRP